MAKLSALPIQLGLFHSQNFENGQKVAILGYIGKYLMYNLGGDVPYIYHGTNIHGDFIVENSGTGAVCLAKQIGEWEE